MERKQPQNIESVIQNYIQGNATVDEEKMLYLWIKENPENRKMLFREKEMWQASKLGTRELNDIEFENWFELQDRIFGPKQKSFRLNQILRIAAIVIFALGAGWFGHYLYSSQIFSAEQAELKTVQVSKGQIKEVFLADGTHVWLNSDSQISFPSNFTEDNREVELSGEAFFEVTANQDSPFLVKTKNHTVKVTGTRFNICEYPESKIIETTLVEGKVKIITGNFIKDLKPGQQSSFNTETAQIRISEPDFEIYTAWKEGRYDFKNESVCKVFKIIERWWDVKIEYSDEAFKNEKISGVLRRYKPVEQHFEVIRQLIPLEYKIDNDLITVVVKK
jgi:ferric-dicitrate binding protein FerR (iron transport regulator)